MTVGDVVLMECWYCVTTIAEARSPTVTHRNLPFVYLPFTHRYQPLPAVYLPLPAVTCVTTIATQLAPVDARWSSEASPAADPIVTSGQ